MPREAEPSAIEKSFVLEALRENVRIDGRSFDDLRKLQLTFGDEFGVADVSLGNTRYEPMAKNVNVDIERI